MSRFRRNFLFLVLTAAALGQTETQIESDEVKRVGAHLNCQCGSCNENLNCMMSAGQCNFCKPARTKIYKMQSSGMSDSQIISSFIQEYGQKIFRPDPNSWFWVVPYLSLAAGAVILFLVLRHLRTRAPKPVMAGGPPLEDDVELARYRDAIDKDISRLD